jgi:hypothetical protein
MRRGQTTEALETEEIVATGCRDVDHGLLAMTNFAKIYLCLLASAPLSWLGLNICCRAGILVLCPCLPNRNTDKGKIQPVRKKSRRRLGILERLTTMLAKPFVLPKPLLF